MVDISQIITIIALNMLVYAKTLNYKYVSDDLSTFKNPPKWKNKWHKWFLWVLGSYKWKEKYDYLLTLIIHTLVCIFIYLAFGANHLSFIASLLFSVNPANNQGSIWISGRGYVLATLLLLIAYYSLFLAPFALMAVGYFNVGYLAPLVFLASKKAYILAIMPIAWWFWWKSFKNAVVLKIAHETVIEDRKFHPRKFILAIKTVGFYMTLAVIPFKITFYHSFLQSCAGNIIMRKRAYKLDKFFYIGLTAILGWIYLSITNWSLATYGMFWYFITIAPFSNFRRLNQEIAERYIYMANVGLTIAVAYFIHTNPILVAVFLSVYISRLFTTMRMYTDDFWLIECSVCEDPGAWYVWHVRGFKRWQNKSFREAIMFWGMAHLLSPKEFKVLFNLSIALKIVGKVEESNHYLKLAEENVIPGQEEQVKQIISDFKSGKFPLII